MRGACSTVQYAYNPLHTASSSSTTRGVTRYVTCRHASKRLVGNKLFFTQPTWSAQCHATYMSMHMGSVTVPPQRSLRTTATPSDCQAASSCVKRCPTYQGQCTPPEYKASAERYRLLSRVPSFLLSVTTFAVPKSSYRAQATEPRLCAAVRPCLFLCLPSSLECSGLLALSNVSRARYRCVV